MLHLWNRICNLSDLTSTPEKPLYRIKVYPRTTSSFIGNDCTSPMFTSDNKPIQSGERAVEITEALKLYRVIREHILI